MKIRGSSSLLNRTKKRSDFRGVFWCGNEDYRVLLRFTADDRFIILAQRQSIGLQTKTVPRTVFA